MTDFCPDEDQVSKLIFLGSYTTYCLYCPDGVWLWLQDPVWCDDNLHIPLSNPWSTHLMVKLNWITTHLYKYCGRSLAGRVSNSENSQWQPRISLSLRLNSLACLSRPYSSGSIWLLWDSVSIHFSHLDVDGGVGMRSIGECWQFHWLCSVLQPSTLHWDFITTSKPSSFILEKVVQSQSSLISLTGSI